MATFLTLTGGLLVGWSALSIGMAELQERTRALRESAVVRRLAQPIRVARRNPTGPKRDIYLIVLDEYANAEITAARYGFDNRAFLDCSGSSASWFLWFTATICTPLLSIPSLLNAESIGRYLPDLGPGTKDPTLPNYLVENNRTVAFLQSQGYRFAFFPSLWWPATRHNVHADVEADIRGGFDVMRELARTELRRDLRHGIHTRSAAPGTSRGRRPMPSI